MARNTAKSKRTAKPPANGEGPPPPKLSTKVFEAELARLQLELVLMQEYIKAEGLKVVVIFEGRDAAGKGGVIKRITERLNPRVCRVVALGTPTEREKTQWYFQRYVAAPARRRRDGPVRPLLVQPRRRRARDGLLHRGGVPGVPALLPGVRADARPLGDHPRQVLVLGQRRRAGAALPGPRQRPDAAVEAQPDGPRSPASGGSTTRGPRTRCSRYTDIKQAPWYVVQRRRQAPRAAQLHRHLLSLIPYEDLTPDADQLPPRQDDARLRPARRSTDQTFVPERLLIQRRPAGGRIIVRTAIRGGRRWRRR